MAPKKTPKQAAIPTQSDTGPSENYRYSQGASQSQDAELNISDIMTKRKDKVAERKKQTGQNIDKTWKKRMAKAHADFDQCLEDYDDELRAIRRPLMERLRQKIQERAAMSGPIDDCMKEMDDTFSNTAQQLQHVLERRMRAMAE